MDTNSHFPAKLESTEVKKDSMGGWINGLSLQKATSYVVGTCMFPICKHDPTAERGAGCPGCDIASHLTIR